jgi:hypothetical protein
MLALDGAVLNALASGASLRVVGGLLDVLAAVETPERASSFSSKCQSTMIYWITYSNLA